MAKKRGLGDAVKSLKKISRKIGAKPAKLDFAEVYDLFMNRSW